MPCWIDLQLFQADCVGEIQHLAAHAQEHVRRQHSIRLIGQLLLPHALYGGFPICRLANGGNAIAHLHFNKAAVVYKAHLLLAVHLAAKHIERVRLRQRFHLFQLCPANRAGRKFACLFLVAVQKQVGGLHLVRAHGNGRHLGGLRVYLNLHFHSFRHGAVLNGKGSRFLFNF